MKAIKIFIAALLSIFFIIHSPKISFADTFPGSLDQILTLAINSDGTYTYIHILVDGFRYVIVCNGAGLLTVYPEG